MASYLPISGTITQINRPDTGRENLGCTINLTIQSREQGVVNMLVPASAYVQNSRRLNTGDSVTCFYPADAPVPLIYPPQYTAAAVAFTPLGTFADLDIFDRRLTNSKNTLRLNLPGNPNMTLPNGQPFTGFIEGKLLLVIYSATTRSIPAQTTPRQIVVFCQAL